MTTCTLPGMARDPLHSEKKLNINARVLPRLLAELQKLATADDRTLSYMVEKAIREYVERHGQHADPQKPRK